MLIDKVLGMGVAVKVAGEDGYSDFLFFISASLWFTPKRCCSSIIANARLQYSTSA